MTDREKLIALLNEAAQRCGDIECCDGEECEYAGEINGCMAFVADHLLVNGVTVQRWIPVTERLPEKGTYLVCKAGFGGARYLDVLSFVEDLYRLDEYDFRHYAGQKKAGFVYYDSEYGYYDVDSVTHWMPLPDMPKEGE